jgi:hypothetical protein
MKEKALYVAAGVLIGIVFANQIKALPGVNKIPTV